MRVKTSVTIFLFSFSCPTTSLMAVLGNLESRVSDVTTREPAVTDKTRFIKCGPSDNAYLCDVTTEYCDRGVMRCEPCSLKCDGVPDEYIEKECQRECKVYLSNKRKGNLKKKSTVPEVTKSSLKGPRTIPPAESFSTLKMSKTTSLDRLLLYVILTVSAINLLTTVSLLARSRWRYRHTNSRGMKEAKKTEFDHGKERIN